MIINKISIIVPAYNEEATISIVIDKLLNLTFINNIKKEIIIVNDCSIDHTENLIQDIIKRNEGVEIVYLKHEKIQVKAQLFILVLKMRQVII